MTAREYLERLRTINRDINAMLDYRQDIINLACRITSAPNLNKVQSNNQTSKVETAGVKLGDYGREIDAKVDELVNFKRDAEWLIEKLADSRMRVILRYRYINNWNWDKIAGDLHYDRTNVWRLHRYALLAFDYILQHNAT